MDKKIAGLLGAAAALTAVGAAHAAPTRTIDPPAATNYRDLLEPIPSAVELLKADDARLAQIGTAKEIQFVQYHHHHHTTTTTTITAMVPAASSGESSVASSAAPWRLIVTGPGAGPSGTATAGSARACGSAAKQQIIFQKEAPASPAGASLLLSY